MRVFVDFDWLAAHRDEVVLVDVRRLTAGPARREPAHFTAQPWPAEVLADMDELHQPGRLLLDTRDRNRYDGSLEPVDPRGGAHPRRSHLPAREMLDGDGRLLSPQLLREQLAGAGALDSNDVVASCGSGVTACHTLLVLEHLGRPPARLYPGSYSQWSRTQRPVSTRATATPAAK